MSQTGTPKTPEIAHPDPAVEAAQLIFRDVWAALEASIGRQQLRFPKEIIWLNGAPGSGKGTNTPFILRERSITSPPIVTSELLNTPEAERIKASGNLVSDPLVVTLLFRKLLDAEYMNGVIVDGFPRTRVQCECLKLLYQKMLELRKEFVGTSLAQYFPQPVFRITVLYVEERESVERQLKRGRQIIAHNQRVRDTGVGEPLEERATDTNEEACRKRYRIFKEQALEALQSLKKTFHYHLINAQADIATVERNIIREFQYQSSLELDDETLDSINHVPLANDIVLNARQNLVRRLDSYQREHAPLFKQVIYIIEHEFMPVITLHSISGRAEIVSENPVFAQPLALHMLLDIFNERGYYAVGYTEIKDIPARFDLNTGDITCRKKPVYRFSIRFQGSVIRRGN
jgi:adenylate kinase